MAIAVLLCSVQLVQSQVVDDGGDYNSQIDNPAVLSLFTEVVYSRLSNLTTTILSGPFTNNASFCIKDP